MSNSPTPPRQFEQTLDIQVPREAVWQALTSGAEIVRWFAPEASVDPQVGGVVGWTWRDHFDWQQTIDAIEPGKHLRTRYDAWRSNGEADDPLFIDFHLEGEGGTTTLRVVHSGFTADSSFDQEFEGISRGWPIELSSLRLYLERHRGKDRQLTWSRSVIDGDAKAVWAAICAPDAFACGAVADILVGGQFAFVTADGDRFEGELLKSSPKEFVGVAKSHGDGFLRVWCGEQDGAVMVWLWLATYGNEPPVGLQARWDGMIKRMFGDRIKSSNAS